MVNWPSSREDLQRLRDMLQYSGQQQAQPGEQQERPWDAAAAAQEQGQLGDVLAAAPAAQEAGLAQQQEEGDEEGEDALLESLLQGLAAPGGEAGAAAGDAADAGAATGATGAAAALLDTGKRKDANEVLLKEGPAALRLLVANAAPFPVKGLYRCAAAAAAAAAAASTAADGGCPAGA